MSEAVDFAAADPLPLVIDWIRSRPKVIDALGGDSAGRIGPRNVAPYPRLIITDPPGGSDRDLVWLLSPVVQVEAVGDVDGRPGKAALRRLLYLTLAEIALLPEQPVTDPAAPVISAVTVTAGGGYVPLPSGQPRYLATVGLTIHPPVLAS